MYHRPPPLPPPSNPPRGVKVKRRSDGIEITWNQRRLALVFFALGAPMGIPLILASPLLAIRYLSAVTSGQYSAAYLVVATAIGATALLIPVAFTIGGGLGVINEHVVRVTATTVEGSSRPIRLVTRRVERADIADVTVVDRGGFDDASDYRITLHRRNGKRVFVATTGSNRKRADYVADQLRGTLYGRYGR